MPDITQPVAEVITGGNLVAKLTTKKLIKDFIVDVITSLPVSGVTITVANIQDKAALVAVLFGIGNAVGGAVLRLVLRWAQSPD
jgi:hypothetical protein